MESRSLRREVFFLGDQLGLRDVTYKPVIGTLQWALLFFVLQHVIRSNRNQFKYRAAPFTFYPNRPRHTLLVLSLYISFCRPVTEHLKR